MERWAKSIFGKNMFLIIKFLDFFSKKYNERLFFGHFDNLFSKEIKEKFQKQNLFIKEKFINLFMKNEGVIYSKALKKYNQFLFDSEKIHGSLVSSKYSFINNFWENKINQLEKINLNNDKKIISPFLYKSNIFKSRKSENNIILHFVSEWNKPFLIINQKLSLKDYDFLNVFHFTLTEKLKEKWDLENKELSKEEVYNLIFDNMKFTFLDNELLNKNKMKG